MVKIKSPGIGPQALVYVSIYQGSIWEPIFHPYPSDKAIAGMGINHFGITGFAGLFCSWPVVDPRRRWPKLMAGFLLIRKDLSTAADCRGLLRGYCLSSGAPQEARNLPVKFWEGAVFCGKPRLHPERAPSEEKTRPCISRWSNIGCLVPEGMPTIRAHNSDDPPGV